jgi:hypothetical protein
MIYKYDNLYNKSSTIKISYKEHYATVEKDSKKSNHHMNLFGSLKRTINTLWLSRNSILLHATPSHIYIWIKREFIYFDKFSTLSIVSF